MQRIRLLVFSLIFALLSSSLAGLLLVDSAKANPSSITDFARLTINGDGNVTAYSIIEDVQFSAKNLIAQNGTTYILMVGLERYEVVIECSNIEFDGYGHSISTVFPSVRLDSVRNVTVKNMELTSDLGHGMMVSGSSNCLITGVNTTGDIFLEGSNNNIITRNTASFYIWTSSNNAVYQNNIESHLIVNASNNIFYDNNVLFHVPPDIVGHNSWNNSDVGNYWGNYSSQGEYMIGKNNIDYHPFAQQVNTSGSAPTPPPFPSATQYISDYIAPIIIIIILIAFVTSILFYRKRQTRKTATT